MSLTRWLAATAITPNQISQFSIVVAAAAGAAFWLSGSSDGVTRVALLVTAAVCAQIRLLCNLLDGMVAVEAGKSAADGAFWNEFPDRIADILILVGAGLAIGSPALGWAAASLSVLTAYIRELGRTSGQEPDFGGPMAKPQRMAVITLAAIAAAFEPIWNGAGQSLRVALYIIIVGTLATIVLRSARLVRKLRG